MDAVELTSGSNCVRVIRRGAQVLSAQFADRQLMWCSPRALADAATPGVAVRGGVPLCFPWFGKHPHGLPSHGFARNRDWLLLERGPDRAVFVLDDDADTMSLWPHRFHAELAIGVDDGLNIAFSVTNTDSAPFRFTYALHTYLAVADARQCRIDGLDGSVRRESGHAAMPQSGPVTFGRSVDAVFDDAPGRLVLHDADRRIAVDAEGMRSAVIWNPGVNDIADVGDQWPEFVCVERGRVGSESVVVEPGRRETASMRLCSI